ncbi:hypothetical protein ACIFOT_28255 [Neobacillus sp. NRS-1170]
MTVEKNASSLNSPLKVIIKTKPKALVLGVALIGPGDYVLIYKA